MRLVLFLILIVVWIVLSCEKDNEESNQNLTTLTGKWYWTRSCGGLVGGCYTHESTGQKKIIEFTADSIYKVYINDTLKSEFKYHISGPVHIKGQISIFLIEYDNWFFSQDFWISRMKPNITHQYILHLRDNCADCFGHSYIRLK